MKNSLLIVLTFLAGLWQVSAQILGDSIIDKVQLFNNPEVLAIRTNLETTFEEVQKNNSWKKYDSLFKNEPNMAIWLKFEVENNTKDTLQFYYYSAHDFTSIYQQIGNEFKTYENGYRVPLYDRSNKNEFYATELKLLSSQKSLIYVRMSSTNKINPNRAASLFSKVSYLDFTYNYSKSQQKTIAFFFFYIISLVTIFIFGLVFWMRLRQKLYSYYLGYLFFQLIYVFTILRTTSATVGNFFLNFSQTSALAESSQFVFIGFYIFFILNLLEIKKYSTKLCRFYL